MKTRSVLRRVPIVAPEPRHIGTFVLSCVLVFFTACTAAQVLRSDLDWSDAQLSLYLMGEYGWMVKSAYVVLGSGLVLMGIGYHRALHSRARSAAPAGLFAAAGVALVITALAHSHTTEGALTVEEIVHGIAASTAFLCITSAMLLQAWRLRGDALWQRRFFPAFGLAVLAMAAMWGHALWRDAPRGLTQKVVILLILAWIAMAAWWLRHHPAGAAQGDATLDPIQSVEPGESAGTAVQPELPGRLT